MPKAKPLCLTCCVPVQPLQGMSRQVAIAKGGEHSVDEPGQPVIQLVRGVGGWVQQILKGGAAICVQLDQQVAEVKGMALVCTRVVWSWRLAIFRRTLPGKSELMQCVANRGEWVGQVPGVRLDQFKIHQSPTRDDLLMLASTQVLCRSSLFPWSPPTPVFNGCKISGTQARDRTAIPGFLPQD